MKENSARTLKRLGHRLLLATFVAIIGLIPILGSEALQANLLAQVYGFTVFFGLIPATVGVYVVRYVGIRMSPECRTLLLEEERTYYPSQYFSRQGWKEVTESRLTSEGFRIEELSPLKDRSGFIAANSDFTQLAFGEFKGTELETHRIVKACDVLSVSKDYSRRTDVRSHGSSSTLFFGAVGVGGSKLSTDVQSSITGSFLAVNLSDPKNPLIVLSMNTPQDCEIWYARIQAMLSKSLV